MTFLEYLFIHNSFSNAPHIIRDTRVLTVLSMIVPIEQFYSIMARNRMHIGCTH